MGAASSAPARGDEDRSCFSLCLGPPAEQDYAEALWDEDSHATELQRSTSARSPRRYAPSAARPRRSP